MSFAARRVAVLVLATAVLFAGTAGSSAARSTDDVKTAAIKVAFVYNFAKFVVWPPERFPRPGAAVTFCVRRGDLQPEALMALEGKQIGDRPITLASVQAGDDIGVCHLLFISGFGSDGEMEGLFAAARRSKVLLVSDQPDFAVAGGHIGLVEDRGRLRFQINLRSVAEADLKLGSQLLQLAEIVGPARN